MYQAIATSVYRRAAEDIGAVRPPAWAWVLVVLNLVVFLPVCAVIGYSLNNIFPVLAIIEDPSPPAYEPLSLSEDLAGEANDHGDEHTITPSADEAGLLRGGQPAVTASLRATFRTVVAQAGYLSLFRGMGCFVALVFATLAVYGVVSAIPFVPSFVAALVSALALVQLYAAWTIILVTAPSPRPFWRRLPSFRKAYSAAALPTALFFVALEVQRALPKLLARLLNLTTWDPKQPDRVPYPDAHDAWKVVVVFLVALVLAVFLVIPAQVVLTRVQVSLLTEEDETIVPFDRSFQGKVEPAIVGGRGYVTALDAWSTFTRASWVRLVKMYLKIFAVSFVAYLVFAAIMVPEAILVYKYSEKVQ